MAPVVLAILKHADEILTIVALTAQDRLMLDQVLDLFRITPDYDLDIMSRGADTVTTLRPCPSWA
jgi:UDP-N-acetylglucosamine 2-epimerase